VPAGRQRSQELYSGSGMQSANKPTGSRRDCLDWLCSIPKLFGWMPAMKLLPSTYSCCPCKTSEPGNAWRAINEALRETGYAAPATTPAEAVAALAAFLEKINRDRPLLAVMSAKAREHVRRNFTMRQVNETMRRFYREAVEMHRRQKEPSAGQPG